MRLLYWIVGMAGVVVLVVGAYVLGGKRHHGGADQDQEPSDDAVELEVGVQHREKVKKAQDFILSHFHEPISPKDVAAAISVTPNWLSKFFSQATGKAVVQYIAEVRVAEARKLLREGELNVTEIAFRVGYNSLRNFRKAFTRVEGVSPSDFKKQG